MNLQRAAGLNISVALKNDATVNLPRTSELQ